jgi:transcriptional regulator with XRE-family HTH domain
MLRLFDSLSRIISEQRTRDLESSTESIEIKGNHTMVIAERLKALREQKNMSQGEIERRTGLLRCYISRVENGHTVPSIETLEKMARALEVPIYVLFYDGEQPPAGLPKPKAAPNGWGSSGRDARMLGNFRRLMSRTNKEDIDLLLFIALKMAQKKNRPLRNTNR